MTAGGRYIIQCSDCGCDLVGARDESGQAKRCKPCWLRWLDRGAPSNPVAEVAAAIATAERRAAPVAEAPFALSPTFGQSRGIQGGLF